MGEEGEGWEPHLLGPGYDGGAVVVVGASVVEPVAAPGMGSSAEGLRAQPGLAQGGKGSGQSRIVA